jgi:uncharacterized protein YecE (DUF72 family)
LSETLSLFDAQESELKVRLAEKLRRLAAQNLFLGASSWKYEGWLGQIYSPERYRSKGRFSQKLFQAECLREYAEVFPIVCGDFAFYQFPTRDFWQKLFAQVSAPFQFAFKAPEEISIPVFPKHPRYGARTGRRNPTFLNADFFRTQFLDLLRPFAVRVSVIIFEFGPSTAADFAGSGDFARSLSRFFASLPKDFRYAVEIRNRELLDTAYFAALREYGVAHVFNSWTHMPAIIDQMAQDSFTAGFSVARALLRPGREYNESVQMFSPYESLKEPAVDVRRALYDLLVRAKNRAEPLFIFVNNRLEGFAPATIEAIADLAAL